ncbi:hypothetical protein Rhopal_006034-T1 [Rhodotorula paludigena]|uniref:Uncharacterized protein n=1 Tax=Rhodotorula paludigena TaxID=86838 RepID=A0AAV5GUU1_9BASI|nr:hypothetical protein Rhopal_006034-T1 [Rhodotorula paludigena]
MTDSTDSADSAVYEDFLATYLTFDIGDDHRANPYAQCPVPDWVMADPVSGPGIVDDMTPTNGHSDNDGAVEVEQQVEDDYCPECAALARAAKELSDFGPLYEIRRAQLLRELHDLDTKYKAHVDALLQGYYTPHHHDPPELRAQIPPSS